MRINDHSSHLQCLWAGGTWFIGQRAFKPPQLAASLVICTALFVAGVYIGEDKATAGSITFSVSAVVFRTGMVYEWAVFFLEKRPHISPPLTIRPIAGHLLIQGFATLWIIGACILGEAYANLMDLIPSLRHIMLVVSYPYAREYISDMTGNLGCLRLSRSFNRSLAYTESMEWCLVGKAGF